MAGEYFPQIDLGPATSLAEQAAKYKVSSGAAWAQMLQSLGQSGSQAMQGIGEMIGQKRQNAITPEQMKGLQQFSQAPAPIGGEKQTFQGGIDPTKKLNPAQQKFLVDTMSQKRTEDRMMALQGLKGNQGVNLEDIKNNHKKEMEDLKAQHAKDLAALKATLPGGKGDDATNRKIVTDYASKNGVSLDALRPGGMGGWSSSNLAMAAQMIKDHPEYDVQSMKLDFAGKMKGATTSAGKAADLETNLSSAHGGFKKSIDLAKPLAGKYTVGEINKIINSAEWELNDNDAIQLRAHMYAAANNFARMAKGGGASLGEDDVKEALKVISTKLTSGGMEAVEKAAEAEYQGRLEGANEAVSRHSGSKKVGAAKGWEGGTTHTYPDGTKAHWDGSQWIKE